MFQNLLNRWFGGCFSIANRYRNIVSLICGQTAAGRLVLDAVKIGWHLSTVTVSSHPERWKWAIVPSSQQYASVDGCGWKPLIKSLVHSPCYCCLLNTEFWSAFILTAALREKKNYGKIIYCFIFYFKSNVVASGYRFIFYALVVSYMRV